MALLVLLTAAPVAAQNNSGGSWSVTDQVGNTINANSDGSGYPLRGPLTGTYSLTQPYQDVLTASRQPNPVVNSAFIPNPAGYQGWLFTGGSTPPGGGYDPFDIWTTVSAFNDAVTPGGGMTGYLGAPYNENINGSITSSTGGTLWAIFQWYDPYPASYYASTHATPPTPPQYIDILLRTTVKASASVGSYGSPPQTAGLSSSAMATNSTFNETATAPSGVSLVQGRHLLRVPVDPNTHKAQVSLGGTATATATDSVPYGVMGNYPGTTSGGYYQTTNGPTGASADASVGATAGFDSREVRIIPTMGTTYHKGVAGLPEANVANSSGTVTDDTVAPPVNGSRLVQPYGAASGSWGANSGYLWSQQCPGSALSALANPGTASGILGPSGAIPAYIVTFSRQSAFSSPIQCSIHLVVKDGVDGATGAADYYVRFHNEYENFIKLTDVRQEGTWTRVSPDAVSGPGGGAFPLPINIKVSVTASVDPSGSAGSAVAAQYGVAVGTTYSTTIPRSGSQWQMGRNKHNWIINQAFWEHMTGTVDNYEGQGYVQQISWSLNKPYNASNPLSDYSEQLVSSDSPPPS